VAKEKNQIIVEMARCMIKEKGLPTSFWGEVVHTAIYILNTFSTHVLEDTTPYEAWFGVQPNISHLQIFGSTYFIHVPKENKKKLDEKSIKCILLGYSEVSKYYIYYDTLSGKIHISKDVSFEEEDITNQENGVKDTPTEFQLDKDCEPSHNTAPPPPQPSSPSSSATSSS